MEKIHVEKKNESYSHRNTYKGISGSLFTNPFSVSRSQYGRSNMADGKLKNHLISIKIGFRGLFGLLITNPRLYFQKSRWRIQYGVRKIEKNFQFWSNLTYRGFWRRLLRICRRIFKIQISGSSTAAKSRKITQFECKWNLRLFELLIIKKNNEKLRN